MQQILIAVLIAYAFLAQVGIAVIMASSVYTNDYGWLGKYWLGKY
jgi:hypothetical protein